MRIFLDIGSHIGQTLDACVNEKYKFDEIHAFEPSPKCVELLISKYQSPITFIHPFGLGMSTEVRQLFHSGSMGASLYRDKNIANPNDYSVDTCQIVSASEWFAENISASDTVIVKINCEGGECDILESLMDSGEIRKVRALMVDWDARKIPSLRARFPELQKRLSTFDIPQFDAPGRQQGRDHRLRTQWWLDQAIALV